MVRIRLIKYKVVRDFIRFTKKIILPGFDGMPLWDVAVFFFQGVTKGSVTSRASSIAFSFFLAVFPMIIVFFTLIPFIPISGFHDQLMEIIMNVTPDSAEVIIIQTVEDIINRPRGGLLSVTFVMALIFATNGFDSVIEAFNNTYHTMESRSWIKQKLVSILLFFIISLIVIICITLIIGGTFVLKFLVDNNLIGSGIEYYLLEIVKYIVLASMFFSLSHLSITWPQHAIANSGLFLPVHHWQLSWHLLHLLVLIFIFRIFRVTMLYTALLEPF